MPPRCMNFHSDEERRQYKKEYQREYRRRKKEQMDDIELENQHLLHNEKQRERYARKRKEMMDAEYLIGKKLKGIQVTKAFH